MLALVLLPALFQPIRLRLQWLRLVASVSIGWVMEAVVGVGDSGPSGGCTLGEDLYLLVGPR